jgi:hypothetical protein
MTWFRRLLRAVAPAPPSPSASPAPSTWRPPPHAYGDQLLTPAQRAQRLKAHARRQREEAKAEADALRQHAEQLKRDIGRQPLGAHFPDRPSPWLMGDAVLERLMNPNPWRQ